jgi:hypothetical protein
MESVAVKIRAFLTQPAKMLNCLETHGETSIWLARARTGRFCW